VRKQSTLPKFIVEMGSSNNSLNRIANEVWFAKDDFIRWPERSLLFWTSLARHADGSRKECYKYSLKHKALLKKAGLQEDARNNGPAILSFRLAGGERPVRRDFPRHHWSIHHIYDGRFPVSNAAAVLHATRDGNHFTQSAGLVALHPLADGLVGDCAYFAWLLQHEAFVRIDYDPNGVFN
jgi:hypothetical protein